LAGGGRQKQALENASELRGRAWAQSDWLWEIREAATKRQDGLAGQVFRVGGNGETHFKQLLCGRGVGPPNLGPRITAGHPSRFPFRTFEDWKKVGGTKTCQRCWPSWGRAGSPPLFFGKQTGRPGPTARLPPRDRQGSLGFIKGTGRSVVTKRPGVYVIFCEHTPAL